MRTRIAWATVVMCILSVSAAAQDGLRSASLPERGPGPMVSSDRDLFLVPPDFYSRRPLRHAPRELFPHVFATSVAAPPWYLPQYWYVPVPAPLYEEPTARPTRRASIPEAPALPSVTLPPLPPGQPKTFYVIPGCYAGDRPPEPEWLPAGCDRSKMRVIPPA